MRPVQKALKTPPTPAPCQGREWFNFCPVLAPVATGAFPSCPEPRPASLGLEGALIPPQLMVGLLEYGPGPWLG